MRTLIVTAFMTLDGVVEAPGGEPTHPHTGWVAPFMGDDQLAYKFDEVVEAETMLLGRVTYESFASSWPEREGPFADRMNAMEKLVASTTLSDPAWQNSRVLDGDAMSAIADVKEGEGGPILVPGSGTLVRGLLDAGLVDVLRIQLFPVTIGAGLRLFGDEQVKREYALASCTPWPTDVIALEYERS